jgi:hypothetical protein
MYKCNIGALQAYLFMLIDESQKLFHVSALHSFGDALLRGNIRVTATLV